MKAKNTASARSVRIDEDVHSAVESIIRSAPPRSRQSKQRMINVLLREAISIGESDTANPITADYHAPDNPPA